MGRPSTSDTQQAAQPSSAGLEPFSVYNSPSPPAQSMSPRAASPVDEKENIAPAGTPPGHFWHDSPDFSGRTGSSAAGNLPRDAKKPAGGKQAAGDKAARRPLRNITPLFVRKGSKVKGSKVSSLDREAASSRRSLQALMTKDGAETAQWSAVQSSMRNLR